MMNCTEKELHCKSCGMDIFGMLYTPKEYSGRLPAVILSHGYNSSHRHISDLARLLAEKGFAVYGYDFRGGSAISKSEGNTTEMSIETEISDLTAVIGMIRASDFADENRIYLYGESQGGFVSALTAAQLPQSIAGLALLYPAFCIPDNWRKKSPEEYSGGVEFMGMNISDKFIRELPEYDVFERSGEFKKPVLLMHGENDTLVDISYSERLSKAYSNCHFERFENEGHGFSAEARRRMREMTAEFFSGLAF